MPEGQVLEFSGVTKRFGTVTAVSDFSARVEPGVVTGFLGPNGAGKTTSLRILLGLVRATEGTATIGGVPYAKLRSPLQTVGAALEASSFHPGRTAANHLKVYAQAARIPVSRVDDALGLVGLSEVAGRRVGGFSLGMRQRLGLAYTLLGDPGVLVLDEPANGLDPEGIKWMRGMLRQLAREGRTVLVSSHLLSEVQQTVDSLLIISQGRLVFQGGLDELNDPGDQAVVVDAPDRAALGAALRGAGLDYEVLRSGLTVRGADPVAIGAIATAAGVGLSSLQRRGASLEEIFLDLVNGVRVHESAAPAAGAAALAADAAGGPVLADEATEADDDDAALAEASAEPGTDDTALPEGAAVLAAEGIVVADVEGDIESAVVADAAVVQPTSAHFAVASTGVIDVVPSASEPLAEPDMTEEELVTDAPASVAEQADTAEEAISETVESEQLSNAVVDASAGGEDVSFEEDEAHVESDAPRTEADLEADRFFAAFDGSAEGAEGGLVEADSDEADSAERDSTEGQSDSVEGEPSVEDTSEEPAAEEQSVPADEVAPDEDGAVAESADQAGDEVSGIEGTAEATADVEPDDEASDDEASGAESDEGEGEGESATADAESASDSDPSSADASAEAPADTESSEGDPVGEEPTTEEHDTPDAAPEEEPDPEDHTDTEHEGGEQR